MVINAIKISLFTAIITLSVISCNDESGAINASHQTGPKKETGGRILVAMGDHDYPPFEYNDKNGIPTGFNIDILRNIAEVMNLDIEINLGPWSEVREKLKKGEIDILAGMYKTTARESEFDFTIPHFISSYVIFIREDSDIKSLEDIKGKDVIVQDGDLGHDFIKENGAAGKIILKREWSETLSALSRGEGDCAIVALMQGLIFIDKSGLTNVQPAGKPVMQTGYCIAVKDGNAALLAKLNEGLNIIKISGEYDRIYEEWFGVYETKKFFNHPYLRIIFASFVILLFIVSAIYLWNRLLQKKVKVKTDALNAELEKSNRMKNQLQESLAELAESKEEILKSKIDAEKSSEAKSFFLAGVSHELRTPLNGILGMTNLLYSTALNTEQKNFLDMLKASADNLFRLMADLLEFSRVASGKFRFEIAPVNIGEFVKNTTSVIKLQAEEKKLSFQVNNSAEDVTLLIDKDRLGQVVFNLAGNAVKYTNTGGIILSISYDGVLQISITDTGIGMDRDGVREIFNPFMQISTAGTAKNKGLGLGLAIVKLIVDTFGGSIDVESAPGAGSSFTVRIPCREVETGKLETVNDKNNSNSSYRQSNLDMNNISVLITEDDQINRVYLERILQKNGWNVDVTDNGAEAVEKTRHKHFDVVLMDLNLPGIDGLTAASMIRSFEETHNLTHTAIIAVTAHAYPEDMAKCREAGMDGYLSKPFSGRKLVEEINKVLGISDRFS